MTLGTTVFFKRLTLALGLALGRAVEPLATFKVFFCEVVEVFAEGFLARPFETKVLEVEALDALRLAGFEAAALFALGRLVLL